MASDYSGNQTFIGSSQEYYTEASEINSLMLQELGDIKDKLVLEPAVGEGAFLHGLDKASRVDAVDVNRNSIEKVRAKFGGNLNAISGDFIDYFVQDELLSSFKLERDYDAVICNPPYGLKFTIEYRKLLKNGSQNYMLGNPTGYFCTLLFCN